MRWLFGLGLGWACVGVLACGGDGESNGTDDGSASGDSTAVVVICTPGDEIPCSCLGAPMSVQTCAPDGSGYGPCECPGMTSLPPPETSSSSSGVDPSLPPTVTLSTSGPEDTGPADTSDGPGDTTDSTTGGPMITACDPFAPMCFGDACKPYDSDGDGTYDANGCFPPGPGQLGDICLPFPDLGSDCDLGLACAFVNALGEGMCVEQCAGTPAVPTCTTPDTACLSLSAGVLNVCTPTCDPLMQDCGPGLGCYPAYEAWACYLDGSGAPLDPCADVDACEPGTACIDASLVPGCPAAGCCSALCDTTGMDPDGACMLVDPTMVCVDWYGPGMAPMGLGSVGVCAAP